MNLLTPPDDTATRTYSSAATTAYDATDPDTGEVFRVPERQLLTASEKVGDVVLTQHAITAPDPMEFLVEPLWQAVNTALDQQIRDHQRGKA